MEYGTGDTEEGMADDVEDSAARDLFAAFAMQSFVASRDFRHDDVGWPRPLPSMPMRWRRQ